MTDQMRAEREAAAVTLSMMMAEIGPFGAADDGFHRFAWTPPDRELRAWFERQATMRGLEVRLDRAGNQWAWWNGPDDGAVTTGSHLDSVPGGGAFDGPLGVVSAFAAVDTLKQRRLEPKKSIGIANFSDEEGARFGVACFGSRVLTGVLDPQTALSAVGEDGRSLASLLPEYGVPIESYGADPDLIARIDAHVELHVEQGYALTELDSPVSAATHIWPHGRWRGTFVGEANHAGTTPMDRRDDPALAVSSFVLAVRDAAIAAGAVATVGRIDLIPGGANVIPGSAIATLDIRAPERSKIDAVLHALRHYPLEQVSWSDESIFDERLSRRIVDAVDTSMGMQIPMLGTGAGHDAGILQNAGVPSAMLFIRNTTGASHTPAEHAEIEDCATGAVALAMALADLASCRPAAYVR